MVSRRALESRERGEGKQGRKGKAALVCFPAVPCCCTKTLTKCNLGKGRVDLAQSVSRAARAGMRRREPLKSQKSIASWLTSQAILILLFDLSRNTCPEGGTTQVGWVGPPSSVTKQENAPKVRSKGQANEGQCLNGGSLVPDDCS